MMKPRGQNLLEMNKILRLISDKGCNEVDV